MSTPMMIIYHLRFSGEPKLFIAKYTYNPIEGPNEFPEMELPLFAGDYVYVLGPMDEDGFYEGIFQQPWVTL